ncbi:Uncharacterised protein [Chlamydia trachomatis]|nr:Uncharacterised protein [Chlamydia trachomatis]
MAGVEAIATAIWARRWLPADNFGMDVDHIDGCKIPFPASPIPLSQTSVLNPGSFSLGSRWGTRLTGLPRVIVPLVSALAGGCAV